MPLSSLRHGSRITIILFFVLVGTVNGWIQQQQQQQQSSLPTRLPSLSLKGTLEDSDTKSPNNCNSTFLWTRSNLFSRLIRAAASTTTILILSPPAQAIFDGGIGGLGKTPPVTGVELWNANDAPAWQDAGGVVSVELALGGVTPVRVSFTSPYPLSTTSNGVDTRKGTESAFLQVVSNRSMPTSTADVQTLLLESVLSGKGKFGAYGAPIDVKVSKKENPSVYQVRFTAFTPGLVENERQVVVKLVAVGGGIVMLVTGTTRQRFSSQHAQFQRILESIEVYETPNGARRNKKIV